MVMFSVEQMQHLTHVYQQYDAARRNDLGELVWLMIGCTAQRDQLLRELKCEEVALRAQLGYAERTIALLQQGTSKLYQQAQSTPKAINSVHVRKSLLELDMQIRALLQ